MAAIAAISAPAPAAPWIAPLDARDPIGVYIAPAPTAGDEELARRAVRTWARAVPGLRFRSATEAEARIRLYWRGERTNYGEMRPLRVGGRRGAAVYVRPEVDAMGGAIARRAATDPLFRDAVVYLTCLHELGHALGLRHTAAFADIMYSFQYGGDIEAYFLRYRRQLKRRADIGAASGLSRRDRARVRALYARDRAQRMPVPAR